MAAAYSLHDTLQPTSCLENILRRTINFLAGQTPSFPTCEIDQRILVKLQDFWHAQQNRAMEQNINDLSDRSATSLWYDRKIDNRWLSTGNAPQTSVLGKGSGSRCHPSSPVMLSIEGSCRNDLPISQDTLPSSEPRLDRASFTANEMQQGGCQTPKPPQNPRKRSHSAGSGYPGVRGQVQSLPSPISTESTKSMSNKEDRVDHKPLSLVDSELISCKKTQVRIVQVGLPRTTPTKSILTFGRRVSNAESGNKDATGAGLVSPAREKTSSVNMLRG